MTSTILSGDLLIFLNFLLRVLILILVLAFVEAPISVVIFLQGVYSVGFFYFSSVKQFFLIDLDDCELNLLGGLTLSEIRQISFYGTVCRILICFLITIFFFSLISTDELLLVKSENSKHFASLRSTLNEPECFILETKNHNLEGYELTVIFVQSMI